MTDTASYRDSMLSPPLDVFQCPTCGATRAVPVKAAYDPPTCGHLQTERTEYPDGGWVRFEIWRPHEPMVFLHKLPPRELNPYAGMAPTSEDDFPPETEL